MPAIEFILSNEKINPNLVATSNEDFGDDCAPRPAKSFVSKEYTVLPKIVQKDLRRPTVKKCVPFLDAMISGYIIPFYQEYIITVNAEKGELQIHAPLHKQNFHDLEQLPENYQEGKRPAGKFTNKWIVRTPPGYSCLFVHPMNQPKTDFEIISGVVDTDSYEPAVFFPYYWRKSAKDFSEGKSQINIKKGDPMVQVIPFKRENWRSWAGKKESYEKSQTMVGALIDTYKKYYWKRKKYD